MAFLLDLACLHQKKCAHFMYVRVYLYMYIYLWVVWEANDRTRIKFMQSFFFNVFLPFHVFFPHLSRIFVP